MTPVAMRRLLCQGTHFSRKLRNTSRILTTRLCHTINHMLQSKLQTKCPKRAESRRFAKLCWISNGHRQQLMYMMRRRYSTCEKTSTQILSKLFPQTSTDLNDEEIQKQRKREEEEDLKQLERSWKRSRAALFYCTIGGIIFSFWALYHFGKPALDENGNEIVDEFSELPLFEQYMARTFKSLNHFLRFIQEPSSMKLLPDPVKPPYVQPPYTLVIEFKDLLVHPDWTYQTGWRFKKRPGVDAFLAECSKYFEIVVYTAEQGMTVFPLLDALDPNGYIVYKLVRDSTHFLGGHHVKNLDNLNRDLKRVVVLDWDRKSTQMHPGNTFLIPRWKGNDDDTTLIDLISFLSVLGSSGVDDVREVLDYYNKFDEPIDKFRENQRMLCEQMEADEFHKQNKQKPMVKKWSSGFMKH